MAGLAPDRAGSGGLGARHQGQSIASAHRHRHHATQRTGDVHRMSGHGTRGPAGQHMAVAQLHHFARHDAGDCMVFRFGADAGDQVAGCSTAYRPGDIRLCGSWHCRPARGGGHSAGRRSDQSGQFPPVGAVRRAGRGHRNGLSVVGCPGRKLSGKPHRSDRRPFTLLQGPLRQGRQDRPDCHRFSDGDLGGWH